MTSASLTPQPVHTLAYGALAGSSSSGSSPFSTPLHHSPLPAPHAQGHAAHGHSGLSHHGHSLPLTPSSNSLAPSPHGHAHAGSVHAHLISTDSANPADTLVQTHHPHATHLHGGHTVHHSSALNHSGYGSSAAGAGGGSSSSYQHAHAHALAMHNGGATHTPPPAHGHAAAHLHHAGSQAFAAGGSAHGQLMQLQQYSPQAAYHLQQSSPQPVSSHQTSNNTHNYFPSPTSMFNAHHTFLYPDTQQRL